MTKIIKVKDITEELGNLTWMQDTAFLFKKQQQKKTTLGDTGYLHG